MASYQNLRSIGGIYVGNSGTLNLNAENDVQLKNDKVASGGSLFIQGENVILEDGFTVDANGRLTIQNR